ncbi:MAG: ankyrin repeat protein [Aureispira sp.]|jgi:ankyrin repeat protein
MSDSVNTQMVLAAEGGALKEVLDLLKQGANPNAFGTHTGALHSAALMGHQKVVKTLLKHGADPNMPDQDQLYPLHLAAREGHTAVCTLLLKAGANKAQETTSGVTALHLAAASNFASLVVNLIKSGCDKDLKDADGNTPLLIASALGNVGVVKSLLKLGADIHSVTQNGSTALLQALWTLHGARADNWEHNDEVNGVPVRCTLEKGYLMYYYNYDKYNLRPGRLMTLKEQRNIARQDWAPFEHLDYLNALEVIKELVKGGVSVRQTDDRGISPLRVACSAGVGSIMELLYKKGASFDEKPWNQVALLHQTAGSGRIDGLKLFFKRAKKTTVNAQDANGWTPAHYLADTGGPLEMAQLLLKQGTDPSIASTEATEYFPKGTTAAKIALHWKDMDLAMELA